VTGLSLRPLRPQALSACGTVESGTLGSDVASWRQAGGVNDLPPPRLARASRTELGQVQDSASGRSCLRGDRSIGAVLSGRNWFVGNGVEHDFSLIGMDFLVSGRGVVHREYAACIGEIFRAAGNGVDALAFDRLARLGVVLDPEQVVEAQFARGVARVAAVGPTLSRLGAVHPSPQRIVGGQTYRFPIATRLAQYARVCRVSAARSGNDVRTLPADP
jgi:hypothetical protein